MHYVTLVAVDIPEIEDEPEIDAEIQSAIEQLKKEVAAKSDKDTIVPELHLIRLNGLSTAFARRVDEAIAEAMNPFDENTDDPKYLEFWDRTEEAQEDYQKGSAEMVRLPDGTFVWPHSKSFSDTYVVRHGKVYQKKVGSYAHEKRTAKAKKMAVVMRPLHKIFPTFKEYAEEYCGYIFDDKTQGYGYYTNPNSFWDWYQIGGRWPFELLVKEDCKEYSLGERNENHTPPPSPEGYIWVSAARKKDIAWDVMREHTEREARAFFKELEKAFEDGKLPKGFFGQITEKGISGWGGMNYIKGEGVEDYLRRKHPGIYEKYCLHPYGFLDENGWNTHESFVYEGGNAHFEQKDEWRDQLNSLIENADDDTVFVIVDSHD